MLCVCVGVRCGMGGGWYVDWKWPSKEVRKKGRALYLGKGRQHCRVSISWEKCKLPILWKESDNLLMLLPVIFLLQSIKFHSISFQISLLLCLPPPNKPPPSPQSPSSLIQQSKLETYRGRLKKRSPLSIFHQAKNLLITYVENDFQSSQRGSQHKATSYKTQLQ